jgi:hypothetical protein
VATSGAANVGNEVVEVASTKGIESLAVLDESITVD